jgi:hypothetical protein
LTITQLGAKILLILSFSGAASILQAQSQPIQGQPSPQALQSPDINTQIELLLNNQRLITPLYEVNEQTVFVGQILYAKKILFHPGGRLLLATFSGDRSDIYIVAETIQVAETHDPFASPSAAGSAAVSSPGAPRVAAISWLHDDKTEPNYVTLEKAVAGLLGSSNGASGGRGSDGVPGNTGYPGRSAPTVYLFVGEIQGNLKVELRGKDGGAGGQGQAGGDGGPGQAGRPAVNVLTMCTDRAGNGSNGGNGGNGGKGGTGGRGGLGGNLIIASTSEMVSSLLHPSQNSNTSNANHYRLTVDLSGGHGGVGGPGGPAGAGGLGGPGGNAHGTCPGGDRGQTGSSGAPGVVGDLGPDGASGQFLVVPLPDSLLAGLLISTHEKQTPK